MLILGLMLIGIAAIAAAVLCSVLEPHVVVAVSVLALLFLVFRIETHPQHLPKGAFYPSRSLGQR
jgi:fumarate reductase subunit C